MLTMATPIQSQALEVWKTAKKSVARIEWRSSLHEPIRCM